MIARSKRAIKAYLEFGGENKTPEDLEKLLYQVTLARYLDNRDEEAVVKLGYIKQKLSNALNMATMYGSVTVNNDHSEANLEDFYKKYLEGKEKGDDDIGKIKPPGKNEELGKLVDEGDVPYPDRADAYWEKENRMKVIFQPNNREIRTGQKISSGYTYENMTFLQAYYNLRSISFGNWLSQKDKMNYVAGLGIALYDLHHILGFKPHQMSLGGKLSVAFGARGRGAALAHFEPDTFCINITRYSRRAKKVAKRHDQKTIKYLIASGGVGSFAHEFGHALDYYGGKYIKSSPGGALSHGRSGRTKPNKKLMKEDSVAGHMERLLNKIIWKKENKHTPYYERLLAGKKRKGPGKITAYYFRRNEIFARAFESYVHYKMAKKKSKNIFLAETKYASEAYLTPSETKAIEKDFDQLVNAIKWKIRAA